MSSAAFSPSAGVYVKEIDLSQRISQVSTSIAAIVGFSEQGPVLQRTLITNWTQFRNTFGNPTPRTSRMHYAAREFLKQGNQLYVTRVVNNRAERGPVPLTAGAFYTLDDITATKPRGSLNVFTNQANEPEGMYDPMNTYVFNPNTPAIENVMFMVCAIDPGKWNNNLYVRVRPSQKAGTEDFDARYDNPREFYLEVFKNYSGVNDVPVESFYVTLYKNINGYGDQTHIEDVVNRKSNLIRVRLNPLADVDACKVFYDSNVFFSGGTIGMMPSRGQTQTGWELYRDPEAVDVNIFIQGGAILGMSLNDVAEVQRTMTTIAESRMDCVALLDVPATEQKMVDARNYVINTLNRSSSYASIYTPDIKILDTYNDIEVFIPPSGFAAASCVVCDRDFGVFYANAGMIRGTVDQGLSAREIYDQGSRNVLNDANINVLRQFLDGSGIKIFGADTLQVMDSALSNLPVRRLMCFIEKSLAVTHLYSVFDPNNVITRSKIESISDRFLRPIKDAGGLYWYQIVCDESNNPPDVIAAGDLNLTIAFDPTIFAKRIQIEANILKTGANFREVAAAR